MSDEESQLIDYRDRSLEFHADGEAYVKLTEDGKVEVNPKYTADEAARVFWQAVTMSGYSPRNSVLLECAEYLRKRSELTGSDAADAELLDMAVTFESWAQEGEL